MTGLKNNNYDVTEG